MLAAGGEGAYQVSAWKVLRLELVEGGILRRAGALRASVRQTNGASLRHNSLLSKGLRLPFDRLSETHADVRDTTLGYKTRGFRIHESLLSCANFDVTPPNLDVNLYRVWVFA